jgi:hemolysin III
MIEPETRAFPCYSERERAADRAVHVVGIAAGALAVAFLLGQAAMRHAAAGQGRALLALGVYGLGLLAMLLCSALYNLSGESARKALFRRLDHAAIFLLIAGTYTPFVLLRLGGPRGSGVLALVWLVAAAGIALKLLAPHRLDRLSVVLYLLLGWAPILALRPLFAALEPAALALLVLGGLLYSIGVGFHLARRLRYHNAIWHLFVLLAAGCHYAAILAYVAA